jgi:hypothetical protein
MSIIHSRPFLRNLLLFDAGTCFAMGAALTLASGPIAVLTRLPSALLWSAGLSLFAIAAFIALVAVRATAHPKAIGLIVVGNALWAIGSFALLVTGWIAPNGVGSAFIAVQALAVAALAGLEFGALRARQPRTS